VTRAELAPFEAETNVQDVPHPRNIATAAAKDEFVISDGLIDEHAGLVRSGDGQGRKFLPDPRLSREDEVLGPAEADVVLRNDPVVGASWPTAADFEAGMRRLWRRIRAAEDTPKLQLVTMRGAAVVPIKGAGKGAPGADRRGSAR
jgi:hypothetical protein